ncbi:MAG TPA: DUF6174 domain-containing protein [Longimicrobiales bacterium]|nr:DUF6174 domain-containing protein [Longimicrobiales bacterium]
MTSDIEIEIETERSPARARAFFHAAFAAALALACAACNDDQGPELQLLGELESHRARWEANRPWAYSFELERQCFCDPASFGPVRVVVEGDAIVHRAYDASGDPVPGHLADSFPHVDGLFDLVQGALESGAHEVVVDYDPTLGYPLDVRVDYGEMTADDELRVRVTSPPAPPQS